MMIERIRSAPLTILAAAGGLLFLLPKTLGLHRGIGGSKLNRDLDFAFELDAPAGIALGLFLLGLALIHRFRDPIRGLAGRVTSAVENRPVRAAILFGLVLLLVHSALFAPIRLNLLRLPDPRDGAIEWRARGGDLVRVPYRRSHLYEDYTRNLVISRTIRELGPARYFELHQAPELTEMDRQLCEWGLRNHPAGYHLFLAPFTVDPVLARATSLVLYSACAALGLLFLLPLIGAAGALLGSLVFWAFAGNLFFIGMMTSNDLGVGVLILAALALLAWSKPGRSWHLWLAGLFLGAAFVTKYTTVVALPLAFLVLLPRRGWKGAILAYVPVFLVFGVCAFLWGVLLSGTEWGPRHASKYFGRLLGRVTDPSRIGTAKSSARGTILDFFVFLPVEFGFPASLMIAAAFLGLFREGPRRNAMPWLVLSLYLVALVAAVLALPKSNYIFFAQIGVAGLAGSSLARRPGDGRLAVAVVVLFGVVRTILYGVQTY